MSLHLRPTRPAPGTNTLTTKWELPIEVTWRITYRGRPARLYGPPEDCYEAEPPEYEIDRILICGVPVPFDALPSLVREGIDEAIRDELPGVIADEAADAAEYRAELRRDAA
jgi:hypothetical protein